MVKIDDGRRSFFLRVNIVCSLKNMSFVGICACYNYCVDYMALSLSELLLSILFGLLLFL